VTRVRMAALIASPSLWYATAIHRSVHSGWA
jgi:hypothetical protein